MTMTVVPTGQLADWLIMKGIAWPADGYQIDDGELDAMLTQCARLHPDYSSEQSMAWAQYSLIRKNRTSGRNVATMGEAAAGDIARLAAEQELTRRGFAHWRDRVDHLADELHAHAATFDAATQRALNAATGISDSIDDHANATAAAISNAQTNLANSLDSLRYSYKATETARAAERQRDARREQIRFWLVRAAELGLLAVIAWKV